MKTIELKPKFPYQPASKTQLTASIRCLLSSFFLCSGLMANATGNIETDESVAIDLAPLAKSKQELHLTQPTSGETSTGEEFEVSLMIKPDTVPPTATLSLRPDPQSGFGEDPQYVNIFLLLNEPEITLDDLDFAPQTPVVRDFPFTIMEEDDQEIRSPAFFFDPINRPVESAQLVVSITPAPLNNEAYPLLVAQASGTVLLHNVDKLGGGSFPFPLVSAECPSYVDLDGYSNAFFECKILNLSDGPVTVNYTFKQSDPGVLVDGDEIVEGAIKLPDSNGQTATQLMQLKAEYDGALPAVWTYRFAPDHPRYTVSSTGLIIGVGDSFGGIQFLDSVQPTFLPNYVSGVRATSPSISNESLLFKVSPVLKSPAIYDPIRSTNNSTLAQQPLLQTDAGSTAGGQLSGTTKDAATAKSTGSKSQTFFVLTNEEMNKKVYAAAQLAQAARDALVRCDANNALRLLDKIKESQKYSVQQAENHVDIIVELTKELNEIGKDLLKFIPNNSIQKKAADSILSEISSTLTKGADKAIQGASGVPVIGQAIAAAKFVDDLAKDYAKNKQIQDILKKMKNKLEEIEKLSKSYHNWSELQRRQLDIYSLLLKEVTNKACQNH